MNKIDYKTPDFLKSQVAVQAIKMNITTDQFITAAIIEKISRIETADKEKKHPKK